MLERRRLQRSNRSYETLAPSAYKPKPSWNISKPRDIIGTKLIKSNQTKRVFKIFYNINCKSKYVKYVIYLYI